MSPFTQRGGLSSTETKTLTSRPANPDIKDRAAYLKNMPGQPPRPLNYLPTPIRNIPYSEPRSTFAFATSTADHLALPNRPPQALQHIPMHPPNAAILPIPTHWKPAPLIDTGAKSAARTYVVPWRIGAHLDSSHHQISQRPSLCFQELLL